MSASHLGADLASTLNLASPPVALAFVQQAPQGVPLFPQQVPSACSLWRHAEKEVFFVPADQHYNCPIGAMTMGFDLPPEVRGKLMELVQMMTEKKYVDEAEPSHIPSVPGAKIGIVYGPLDQFPLRPDLVLVWATPAQAMILVETLGDIQWNESPGVRTFGRPACAAIPAALKDGKTTLSLGCMGMRTFTGIEESRMLVVVPGKVLDEKLRQALRTTTQANEQMRAFYQKHRELFPILN